MIIDLQTQVWTNSEQLGREAANQLRQCHLRSQEPCDASPASYDRAMECVDVAVVVGYRSALLEARIPAEFVAEFVSKSPDRRIGIAGVDPMDSEDGVEQVNDAAALGMAGIALSPVCQGFHPAHSAAMLVYERCAELRMPVFVRQQAPLTASAVLEFGRPSAWDEVARSIPSLRIVMSQLGYPWIDETLTLAAKHEHVYADLSGVASRPWQLYTSLLTASGLGMMDKLLFGSGFPFGTPAGAIETMYTVNTHCHGTQLPSIPRAAVRAIVERDSLRCLGIEHEDLRSGDGERGTIIQVESAVDASFGRGTGEMGHGQVSPRER
jgi:uncharacterized protein